MTAPRIQLVAFDMEGCLTADPTVWELMHRKLGTWESHGQPYWDRYRAGGLDYDTFARMDVAVWAGAPVGLLAEASREVAWMPGCTDLLTALRRAGTQLAILSNGLHCVADRFGELGVEHILANRVVARDGRLTGELEIRLPYEGKGEALRALARKLGVSCESTAAVGDSASDVAMFREAYTRIAFRAEDPQVAEAATHVVRGDDLAPLGAILGL